MLTKEASPRRTWSRAAVRSRPMASRGMLPENHAPLMSGSIRFITAAAHHRVIFRVRVRHDDRGGRLLGHELEAVRHFDADGAEVEQPVDDRMLAQIGAGW